MRGTLAQLVEQRTENPCVPGSIPGGTTQSHSIEWDFFLKKTSTIKSLKLKLTIHFSKLIFLLSYLCKYLQSSNFYLDVEKTVNFICLYINFHIFY